MHARAAFLVLSLSLALSRFSPGEEGAQVFLEPVDPFSAAANVDARQGAQVFLEPVDPFIYQEWDLLIRKMTRLEGETGETRLWVFWTSIFGSQSVSLTTDRIYEGPHPSDPFEAERPFRETHTLVLSKCRGMDFHDLLEMENSKDLDRIEVERTRITISPELRKELQTLWVELTLTLRYPPKHGWERKPRQRFSGYKFLVRTERPRQLGEMWDPQVGPLYDFANLVMRLDELIRLADPEKTHHRDRVRVLSDDERAALKVQWEAELIAMCKSLEAALKERK